MMTFKTVFINGANSTSAKCLAHQLSHQAFLGLAARDPAQLCKNLGLNSDDLLETEMGFELKPKGSNAFPHGLMIYRVDATDLKQVSEALQNFSEKAQTELGPGLGLNGYVHFPGSVLLKPIHMTKPEEWDEVLRVNLTSAFYGMRSAVNIMRKETNANAPSASLVFISSVAAQKGLPAHEAISAAKAGVEGLVRSAAASYPTLRINCVAPGLTDAKVTQKIIQNENALEASLSLCAIKRPGSGQDIASAVDFLLSENSTYMTGQVIAVDGGMSTLGFPRSDSKNRS